MEENRMGGLGFRWSWLRLDRRRRWTLAALAALTVVALAALALLPREPSYQGRRLSAWLQDLSAGSVQARTRAAEAIREMGPAIVPSLVRRLEQPGSLPLSTLGRLKFQIVQWLHAQQWLKLRPVQRSARRDALAALDALGPAAVDALPAPEKLVHESQPDPTALYVVARIGPAGLPVLHRALTNEASVIRTEAQVCLQMYNAHDELLFGKPGVEWTYFDRRVAEFNMRILHAALKAYTSQHLEPGGPFVITSVPAVPVPPDWPLSSSLQESNRPTRSPRSR